MPPPQRTVTRGVMVSISLCFHVSALITVGTVSVSLNLKRLCILGRRCRLRFTFLDRKVTVQSRIYWREKIPLILRFFLDEPRVHFEPGISHDHTPTSDHTRTSDGKILLE